MSSFDFVEPLLEYVKDKAKKILEKHGIENEYVDIERNANENKNSLEDYINSLLNSTVDAVAKKENKSFKEIREEFNSHYLSQN
ncbi:hypothetical protein [Prevotella intermedia]|uniref:Uncharacterized protein n=1 Tax=Prevotella intermedia TaxID=28131 RepID=A0A0S3UJP9_PREIN|nr:hypothetical protein [Prevotella intermedia]AWX07304.1 hypothetical protein CTM55_06605 [Prevotella intermedia]BAU17664.1 hypothetical protein PIOMA14_I_1156 [Prevotella intermedia]